MLVFNVPEDEMGYARPRKLNKDMCDWFYAGNTNKCVMCGPSGIGKSTLVCNPLFPCQPLAHFVPHIHDEGTHTHTYPSVPL